MTEHILTVFSFPAVGHKKVRAAFDGGRLPSDAGVMVLAQAERRLGLAERLAECIADRRDPIRTTHADSDILRARILAIACGYEDGDDLDEEKRETASYSTPDAPQLSLGGGHGLVEPQGPGVAVVEHHGRSVLRRCS